MSRETNLKQEFTEEVEQRVIQYRNRFAHTMRNRYMEMLPTLITYRFPEDQRTKIQVDFVKLEYGLRFGYEMAIGQCTDGVIRLLGYHVGQRSKDEIYIFDQPQNDLTINDLNLIIAKELVPQDATEITFSNPKGDFVVLRNKSISLNSDYEIIQHYVEALTEIAVSRFSLSMQLKMMTFFIGQPGDETVNQVANKLYNGAPYVKVSKFFDPEDNMQTFDSSPGAANLTELKREYQNYLSELNNMLGINSLAVEKNSGVSDTEAKGNTSFVTSNANIYMDVRRRAMHKLNDRFGTKITTEYNDRVASEISAMSDVNINNASQSGDDPEQ